MFVKIFSKIFFKNLLTNAKKYVTLIGGVRVLKKEKTNEHMFAIYLYGLTCLNTDMVLQGTKLSSDGLLYPIKAYILSTKKQALNRISELPYISSS